MKGNEGQPEMEHVAPIKEIEDPFIERQEKRLDDYIKNDRGLDGMMRAIKSPHFESKNLAGMIDDWNEEHQEWSGGYIEKEFRGLKGEILMVRMDKDDNFQLAGGYNAEN